MTSPEWFDVILLVPKTDQAALRPQADEYGAGNDFRDCGEWDGGNLVVAVVDAAHLVAVDTWAASKAPETVMWRRWEDLPSEMQAELDKPNSDPTKRLWATQFAGRMGYVRRADR